MDAMPRHLAPFAASLSIVLLLTAGAGSGALAQGSTLPDATAYGPPAWVQPGVRLSFYAAGASVAQSRFAWVEDVNGDWQDPATGKRYRRTDETGEGVGGGSGDGVTQIDILAVEGKDVVLASSAYGIDRANNQFAVLPGSGGRVPGGVVDGAWIHPDLLAKLQDARQDGVLVLRGDYPLGGTTYHAISFASTSPGSSQSYTYDTETGLLLSATTSTAGATSPVTAPGEAPPQGNTELTITRFLGTRQLSLPGLGGANPDWVARTPQLRYSGTYDFRNPVDPSSGSLSFPMDLTVDLGVGGRDWATFKVTSQIGMPGSGPSYSSGATGTTGLYWLDPAALTGLTAGQQLDQDPVTGAVQTVSAIGTGVAGRTVSITTQLPGVTTVADYDAGSGVLAAYEADLASSGATIRLALQNVP
jgi:hypothetical protein